MRVTSGFLCFLNERLQLEFREYEVEKECGVVRHSTKNVDRLQEEREREREREEESVCIVGSQGQVTIREKLFSEQYTRSDPPPVQIATCRDARCD